MKKIDFKALLGLERSISLSNTEQMTDCQLAIAKQVESFGIDEIYFSTDEARSYPAVFLKKVVAFDELTIKEISLLQQKLWNYQKVLFLYVYNDTEIRIYNCVEKPFARLQNSNYGKELENLEMFKADASDDKAIARLVSVFSSIAVDSGIIWTLPEAFEIRKKINIQRRVDKYLVDSLKNATLELKKSGLEDVAIIHKIILRSLFLLYLEDREATSAEFYGAIKDGAKGYFDILKDVNATYKLFAALEDKFNGNVFSVLDGEQQKVTEAHLKIVRKCFINGYENSGQIELFEDWRLFDFKIIRIELLSEIYERFLEESNPKGKKGAGAYYTPTSLVELILDEVLPTDKQYTEYNVKILDPACGSGIFLVESYKRLLKRYENAHHKKPTDFEELKNILLNNIYGIEQNDQAIIVAAFSLYLALVDNLDPKTLWISTKLPCLVNDPDHIVKAKEGHNLFCTDTIAANDEIEGISFDLVVGNPPFGTENRSKGVVLSDSIRNYCNQNGFAKEMVLPFLHKAVKFSPKGKIAMIFNTKLLTNTSSTYKSFRKWLFNDCYVEKVYNFSILRNAPKDFGGQLFGSAIGPICIAFYQKEEPDNKSGRIVYYAPKTYIKSNVLEGVVIDSSDVKYLPREECQKPDTKIWKIAMWGGDRDFELIKRLDSCTEKIANFISNRNMSYGVGLQPYNASTEQAIIDDEISTMRYIRPEHILRYYTPSNQSSDIKKLLKDRKTIKKNLEYYKVNSIDEIKILNVFRRIGAKDVYCGPMLLVKEGLSNKKICASIVKEPTVFNSSVLGIKSDLEDLRLLSSLINSKLATYYLLMISGSWGMERERTKPNEIYTVPLLIDDEGAKEIAGIHSQIEQLNEFESKEMDDLELKLEQIIQKYYSLTDDDISIISDFIDYSTDLFYKQEGSMAIAPILDSNLYLNVLCRELQAFLEGQNLFVNGTTYITQQHSPLAMAKISFGKENQEIVQSELDVQKELKKIDKHLWEEKGGGIYFRKKLNYYDGDSIYIIRPNQRRFWTQSMAMQDASDLIIEILNNKEV